MRGQTIADALTEAKSSLDGWFVGVATRLGLEELATLDMLRENLSSHRGIRAQDYFVVGNSSLLTVTGLFITYYIVLLQFRVSEIS